MRRTGRLAAMDVATREHAPRVVIAAASLPRAVPSAACRDNWRVVDSLLYRLQQRGRI
jgi:hypothetical protein